jgi:hypothetical protein
MLMTSAYNEAERVPRVLQSVAQQRVRPVRWIFVDDGSTDGTGAIVREFASAHGYPELHVRPPKLTGNITSKEDAIRWAWDLLRRQPADYVGILDCDVSVGPEYYQSLISRLELDPRLGLVSGYVFEPVGGQFRSRRTNRRYSVAGAAPLFKQSCYQEVAKFPVLPYGGMDCWQQLRAGMLGWTAESFPEIEVHHHRLSTSARGSLRGRFGQGLMDYSLGHDPLFELLKCAVRIPDPPVAIGAASMLLGFVLGYVKRESRPVPADFIRYVRAQQRARLRGLGRLRSVMARRLEEPSE